MRIPHFHWSSILSPRVPWQFCNNAIMRRFEHRVRDGGIVTSVGISPHQKLPHACDFARAVANRALD